MYSATVCDPVNTGIHAIMRLPALAIVAVIAVGGVTAYKCYRPPCTGRVIITQNSHGSHIAVCVAKKKQLSSIY